MTGKGESIGGYLRWKGSSRVQIVIPFVIIAVAFTALGYRSWQLSGRMEGNLESIAIQYLEFSAEITARRVDAATQAEIFRASEEWQQLERQSDGSPHLDSLAAWVRKNAWVVSAIYVPDADPTGSIFFSETATARPAGPLLSAEFYTASGSVQYTYAPAVLIAHIDRSVFREPGMRGARTAEAEALGRQATVGVVPAKLGRGLVETPEGLAAIVPLGAPLESFAIEASLDTRTARQGWRSHRIVSLTFALAAIALLTLGAWLAIRGLRQESEAAQLRTALVANVSHELRTPLAMIRLAAETLQRGQERLSSRDRADMQASILREVLHLSHLVENVLDVARLQKGARRMAFSPVDPAGLVWSVIESYSAWIADKGFTVDLDIAEGIGEQMWDREAVQRAFVNLIDNAIKYSDAEKNIAIALHDRGEAVAIEVRDRGLGVQPSELQRIFDPYYRARFSDTETRRGAGLGLTLVQQIAQAHGGRVEVESEPGRGSTFRLVIPKRRPAAGDGPGRLPPPVATDAAS